MRALKTFQGILMTYNTSGVVILIAFYLYGFNQFNLLRFSRIYLHKCNAFKRTDNPFLAGDEYKTKTSEHYS